MDQHGQVLWADPDRRLPIDQLYQRGRVGIALTGQAMFCHCFVGHVPLPFSRFSLRHGHSLEARRQGSYDDAHSSHPSRLLHAKRTCSLLVVGCLTGSAEMGMRLKTTLLSLCLAGFLLGRIAAYGVPAPPNGEAVNGHREAPDDPYVEVPIAQRVTSPATNWERNGYLSIQVNVDSEGNNIVGDAANEPSIAVDPTNPDRMAIGWRQFDTISSNFRQAGRGYTTDGGQTWTFPGVLEPGVFRSDPVLDFDAAGNFYYDSLEGTFCTSTFMSSSGGQFWGTPVFSHGGDKQWLGIDRSGGIGDGHIYHQWNSFFGCTNSVTDFNRSTDGGQSFDSPVSTVTEPVWGTTAVGPAGEVYVVGSASTPGGYALLKSTTLQDPALPEAFQLSANVDLGGPLLVSTGPNPGGLLGQVWVAADPTVTLGQGTVYVLSSVNPPGGDPLDVHFVRSTDGGATFSAPVKINDDPGTTAWQWFGTMSVAPNGRIDVIWNDTRDDPGGYDSELFYSFSSDGGLTWSANIPISPAFDPHLGWPNQSKIGDYYDMVSDLSGAHLAYSATFNGEQDVYYLHIAPIEMMTDDFETGDTSRWDETTN